MKSLLPFFFLIFIIPINAQSVILLEQDSVSEVHENVDISDLSIDFPLDLYFKNNTNDTISVNWRREFGDNCPAEWEVFTSDQIISYVPDVDESQAAILLTPADSHFIVREIFRPRNVVGCCDIKMIFSLDGDPGNPIDTGYYHIEINSNQCSVTAVLDKEIKRIKVYPNPTSDFLFIENEYLIESMEIIDLMGKIYWKEVQFDLNQIDLSSLPVGIYYLKIRKKEGREMIEKIVKQ